MADHTEAVTLLSPITLGPYTLRNRVFMAPLTRCRCPAADRYVPGPLNALYYRQRAGGGGAGLIISEATCISEQARGYPDTPGIHTPEQVRGWRLVTDAVHDAGGRIFCQLWHVGRVSHPAYQPGGALPVAPSAIEGWGGPGENAARLPDDTKAARPTPRALTTDEIPRIIADYRHAAQCALEAGFDGVEVHGANGYLPDQFLRSGSNHRTDPYGGSVENRARFLLEATRAAVDVWGADRVGVRLAPSAGYSGMHDADPLATFCYVLQQLGSLGVVYAHVMHAIPGSPVDGRARHISEFRPHFPRREPGRGVLIANAGLTLESGNELLRDGHADAVAFGQLFIANPDLAERFRRAGDNGATLTTPDTTTYYSGGERGYTDYAQLG